MSTFFIEHVYKKPHIVPKLWAMWGLLNLCSYVLVV